MAQSQDSDELKVVKSEPLPQDLTVVKSEPLFTVSPEAQKVYGKGQLPGNLPQIVGKKILQYVPAAAATTGAVLAPEGTLPAIGAAMLFGGAGSAVQQGIQTAAGLPEAPKTPQEFYSNVGQEMIGQGAAEGSGRFINAALRRIFGRYLNPEQLYQSALKPPPGQGAEQVGKLVQTGLSERIPLDPKNWETNWQALNNQINGIISTSPYGAVIDPTQIAKRLDALKAEWASGSGDPAFYNAIDKVQRDFESRWQHPLTPAEAQEAKKQIYKEIRKSKETYYTANQSAVELDAKAELARGFMQELQQLHPELQGLNQREGAMIDLQRALERFSAREGNKVTTPYFAPLAAFTALGGGLGAYHSGAQGAGEGAALGATAFQLLRSAMEDPTIKSKLAFALDKARSTTTGKTVKIAAPYVPATGIRIIGTELPSPGLPTPPQQ